MIELTNMLKEILAKDSLEEYFSNDEKVLSLFMGEFMKEVLENILIQPKKIIEQLQQELILQQHKQKEVR